MAENEIRNAKLYGNYSHDAVSSQSIDNLLRFPFSASFPFVPSIVPVFSVGGFLVKLLDSGHCFLMQLTT